MNLNQKSTVRSKAQEGIDALPMKLEHEAINPVVETGKINEEVTKQIAEILGIEVNNQWKIVDFQDGLAMVHYNDGANMDLYGKLRGVLIDLETSKVIADSFGYTPIAVQSELEVKDNKLTIVDGDNHSHVFSMDNVFIKRSFEGVVIRTLWYNNKFYRMTHKKINAEKSKWGSSKFFTSIYEEAGGPTVEQLFDTSKPYSSTVYDFIVVDSELMIGSKQQVNKPYIVLTSSTNFDIGKPDHQVASGIHNFQTSSEVSEIMNKTFIHKPVNLSIDEANYHLKFGFYCQHKFYEELLATGEAVIVYSIKDGVVEDLVKVHSKPYEWRLNLRGNEPNCKYRFYSLLDSAYCNSYEELNQEFMKKYIIFPFVDVNFLKKIYNEQNVITNLNTKFREDLQLVSYERNMKIFMIWLNFLISLPPYQQEAALDYFDEFLVERDLLIQWITDIELKVITVDFEEIPDKAKRRIINIMKEARTKVSRLRCDEEKKKEFIKASITNFLCKERGNSLYGLVRAMKKSKETKN